MMVTTLTNREFNQETSRAKSGSAFITDRDRQAHVLLAIEDYQRLADGSISLSEALAQPGEVNFEFNARHVAGGIFRPADLD
jgi:hypothetical protein